MLPRDVVVLGAGPVGMVSALEFSKRARTTLISRRLPSIDDVPSVEAVPASLLALLLEYGVHPREIGVEGLQASRLTAWEQPTVVESPCPSEAHVERPALDLALLRAVVASRRVRVVVGDDVRVRAALRAARDREVLLIDATGRSAVSARRRIHPPRPWAARTFLVSTRSRRIDQRLRIAALPGGFAYRLAASRRLLLGVVGRGETIAGGPHFLEQRIEASSACWMLEGLPPIGAMTPGRTSTASVQWATGGDATTIGDAALARDVLSSNGLAAGISEALYAAACGSPREESYLALRKVEQRLAHLRSLQLLIARCRYRQHDTWRDYADFLAKNADPHRSTSTVALRAGRLRIVKPVVTELSG